MKVYIVRHGEVPHNVLKIYSRDNEDLTEIGRKQAEELRDKIKHIHFDIVISSPLLRTMHTAKILTYYTGNIITDDRLIERDCGDLSGKHSRYNNREEYWNYYTDMKFGTSENIKDFFKRVYNFLDELKKK